MKYLSKWQNWEKDDVDSMIFKKEEIWIWSASHCTRALNVKVSSLLLPIKTKYLKSLEIVLRVSNFDFLIENLYSRGHKQGACVPFYNSDSKGFPDSERQIFVEKGMNFWGGGERKHKWIYPIFRLN